MDERRRKSPARQRGRLTIRKKAAITAYYNWMPVSDPQPAGQYWREYQIGALATLFKTESRITGRSEQLDLKTILKPDMSADEMRNALLRFRDHIWMDKSRSMLGNEQSQWLAQTMAQSVNTGTKWQIWPQQCIMGNLKTPPQMAKWTPDNAPDYVKDRVKTGLAAASIGLPFNFDAWDGYPAARSRHLTDALNANANLIVLTGDSHNGWAFDLDEQGTNAGVEWAGHSVTSPGYENYLRNIAPDDIANALVGTNDQLQWADTSHRGYMTVKLAHDKAECHWHNLATIAQRNTALSGTHIASVQHGDNKMQAA